MERQDGGKDDVAILITIATSYWSALEEMQRSVRLVSSSEENPVFSGPDDYWRRESVARRLLVVLEEEYELRLNKYGLLDSVAEQEITRLRADADKVLLAPKYS